MTLEAGDKLMSLTDLSEMLDIPVHTLYRWRYRGDGPVGYRWAVTCGTAEKQSRRGWNSGPISASKPDARKISFQRRFADPQSQRGPGRSSLTAHRMSALGAVSPKPGFAQRYSTWKTATRS
jgi:hypothetical protein